MNRNFFAELKRRNVYRVAVAYAVVGWLVMQVAATIVPALHLPGAVTTAVVVLVLLGFPIALVLAWAFELTPEGIKRTEEVAPGESITHRTGRKIAAFVVIAGVGAAALLAFQLVRTKGSRPANTKTVAAQTAGAIPVKSIAVLPFASLSEDKANEYFASGIQDEILTRLAKIAELKVISRTSTQQYQSKPGNLPEIARQLGVAHILEGSVQKSGDAVRVNVQLIRADTDAHLWAETYDGKLSEIFKVQSDIALRIASALEAKLTGRERNEIGAIPTNNEAAYEAYLRGLALDSAQTGEETEESRASFRRAVELDPNFALAWAALTKRESFRYFSNNRTQEQLTRAQQAMEMALKLAPDASESHVAAASFYYYCPQDFDRALEWLTKARERAPNNAAALMLSGLVKRRQGKLDESIELMKQAVIFDPRHNDIWMNLARSYRGARRFREAHAMYDHALTIAPRTSAILAEKAEAFFAAGDLDAAERLFGPEPPPVESEMYDEYLDLFYLRRDFERAIALHRHAIETLQDTRLKQSAQLSLAYILMQIGRVEEARPTIDLARREIEKIAATGDQSLWIRDELLALAAIQGEREVVFREAEKLLQMTAKDRWRFPISHESIARAYVLLGEFDRAIPHLEQTLAMPSQQGLTPAYLQLEAFWDPIRNHPRFQELAAGKP